jgi:hypothetical protein
MGQSSPEAKKAWLARNQHKRKEINRNWKLRNVYGITPERFDEMYFEQGGKCAICSKELHLNEDGYNELHVDHDHATQYVRGLLCSRCNLAIGQFEDSITFLQRAVLYLQERKTPDGFVFSRVPNPPRVASDKQRAAVRAASLGNTHAAGNIPWNKGKHWDSDTKSRMSESAKNRASSEEGKAHLAKAGKAGADARWKVT